MVGDLTPALRVADRARPRHRRRPCCSRRPRTTDTADLVPARAPRCAARCRVERPAGSGRGSRAGSPRITRIARLVFSAVAGGCGATAFVWAQHHGAVRRLTGGDGPGRDRWLPSLCDGSLLAGIGFAYLRRPGPPAVRAVPSGSGWRLEGAAPWITGWGLADALRDHGTSRRRQRGHRRGRRSVRAPGADRRPAATLAVMGVHRHGLASVRRARGRASALGRRRAVRRGVGTTRSDRLGHAVGGAAGHRRTGDRSARGQGGGSTHRGRRRGRRFRDELRIASAVPTAWRAP